MSPNRQHRIAALPEHKRNLLRDRLAGRSAPAREIHPAPRDVALPLSFAQQRLWFLDEFEPGNPEYNTAIGLRLSGPLDVPALESALDAVVARHESLRTTFDSVDGHGRQVIHPAGHVRLARFDLSTTDDREGALERLVRTEMVHPFDLREGPLLRPSLVVLAECAHVLLLSVHHIVTDGWSMEIIARELATLYEANLSGRPAALPTLDIQYADFAVWQRERCTDDSLATDLAYWRTTLAGIAPLDLPTDRPRPAQRSSNGALHTGRIAPDVVAGLRALCADRGATLFMVLTAATTVLLSRWSDCPDVALGTVTSGRGRSQLDNLVGFFNNTVVLRSQVDPSAPAVDLLDQVKETVLEAFAHQDVPFDRVVDELAPDRDPSRPTLVQALLVLQNAPVSLPRLAGLRVEPQPLPCLVAAFDLTIEFTEHERGLDLAIEYSTDLFDAASIERMAGHLATLLASFGADPNLPVSALPMLPDHEYRQVVVDWNDTTSDRPSGRVVHELFEAAVDRDPGATAVVFGDTALSYGELDARANRLAHHLMDRGVGPDVLVGLCVPRGPDLVVGLLGILKAGGGYVPLDPEYPPDRLALMLADTAAPLVVTMDECAQRLPSGTAELVRLDADATALAAAPRHRPVTPAGPDDLAYVIYTSGSTGAPKGVMIEHRNLLHIAHAWNARYDLAALRLTFVSVCGMSVDLFLADLLRSVFFGGTIVISPPEVTTDPPRLLELLERTGATALELAPSLLRVLADEARWRGTGFPPLRLLSVGSEGWRGAECRAFLDQVDERTLVINAYGGTEATIDSCLFTPSVESVARRPVVPIGRPIANTRAYVLDRDLNPTPIGVPGELCIAGDGLARGYWNRPDLTEERFVPAPFGGHERLYRTGDRARWLPDGNLEYLGRVDQQVKIRGFRIEPGEVESALLGHPDVAQAVVVGHDDGTLRRLVGYVVAADGARLVDADLRGFLTARLPDHLVPSVFVTLDALPLTVNGKVDHRALPAPDPHRDRTTHVEPRTRTEALLAEIWSEVLGVEPVGVEDDFFQLGGDSILSIQVVARARAAGFRLTSKDVFTRPTVAALAASLDTAVNDPAAPAVAMPATGPVPLTPIQHWFFETHTVRPDHYTMSVLFELTDDVHEEALGRAVDALLAQHDALRMRFERDGHGGWRQYCPATNDGTDNGTDNGDVLHRIDLATLEPAAQDEAVQRAATHAQAGLDLRAGPIVRALLFDLGSGRRPRLFLTVHHLVVDGVSWRILLADLRTAYQQAVQGVPIDLGRKTTSYREWAAKLSDHVLAGRLDHELDHWTSVAESDPALPTDLPGPNTAATAREVFATLGRQDTDALLHSVPTVYRTRINDLLISALGRVLARWTGRDRILIGMEGHGREDIVDGIDLSRTVGWFTTHFPVALTIPDRDGWRTLISSVKEQLRSVPGQGLGNDALRYLGGPDSAGAVLRTSTQPLISFNYLGQWDTGIGEPGHDGPLGARCAPVGRDHSPEDRRGYLLDVVCAVEQGQLSFAWMYSTNVHHEATIRQLAEDLVAALRELVAHCAGGDAGGCTPSDFALAGLDQAGVDRIAGNGRGVEDIYPLTPMQEGMLFHALMNPGSGVYTDQLCFVLDGVTDPRSVGAAWQAVADRTPVLRTGVVFDGLPRPLQVVHRQLPVPITYLDWTGLSEVEWRAAAERQRADDRAAGVDITRPPLLRLAVARTSASTVWVCCTSHHLLLDGWSTFQVLSDVVLGRSSARRPFRDYVAWLAEQDADAARAFWRDTLSGFDTPTPLPYDRLPTQAHHAESTAMVRAQVPADDSATLERFARHNRLTVNTLVQGAWALLLSRYSGQRDICFGTTVSGRPPDLPGADSIIGIFINTLPLRVTVDPGQDTVAWLQRIQRSQADAGQHDFISLAEIQSCADLPGRANLFDTTVMFQNFPIVLDQAADGGLRLDELVGTESTNYPLHLLARHAEQVELAVSYDPRLFDEATVQWLATHLVTILRGMAANPRRPLAALPMLTAEERRLLTVAWNDTEVSYPDDRCLPALFEEQAARTPDAIAVRCAGTAMTYRELNSLANTYAHRLLDRGVGVDVTVAVMLRRSAELMVALLAVLKAGGGYVAVDPDHPTERIGFVLADSGSHVLLSQPELLAGHPGLAHAGVIDIDLSVDGDENNPPGPADPDDLAYLTYTSGSTGRPKGVAVTHRGLVNYLHWALRTFPMDGRHGSLVHSPVTFDLTVTSLYLPLLAGKDVTLLADGPDVIERLAEALTGDHDFSIVRLTPAHLDALRDQLADRRVSARTFVVGGEALGTELAAAWRDLAPDVALYNHYGPSETVVGRVAWPVPRTYPDDDDTVARTTVPIGRPIANTTVYVLDAGMDLLPIGAVGELFIGGVGLARGYWNRPDLTAERFVPDPFHPGQRLYRTGDLVRWLPDGLLEFVGRTDSQVKVRGYRIELGEVEAAMRADPDVAAAVVGTHGDGAHRELVGYLVWRNDSGDQRAVLDRLRDTLPRHMVPAVVVELAALPLTANGKVDRRALPAPDGRRSDRPYQAPRDATERLIAGIWSTVLGVERVGAHDDFFDLGGHSVRAIRVIARIRAALGVVVPVRTMFEHSRLDRFAQAVAGTGERATASIRPRPPGRPARLSFAQERLWFLHELDPDNAEYNVATCVRLTGPLDVPALRAALDAVAARHEVLRTSFEWTDGDGVAVIHPPAPVAFRLVESPADQPGELDRLVRADAVRPFDLTAGPPVRVLLVRLTATAHVLLLTMHHIVTDGLSTGIILAELAEHYEAARRDGVATRPALPSQYADFAAWQREQLDHADDLAYWRARLAGIAALELPTDRPRPAMKTSSGAVHIGRVAPDVLDRLDRLGHARNATLFMVLAAATQVLLARWSGTRDIALGTVVSGRDRAELENLVGFFVNTVVLRADVDPERSFADLLDTARETVLDAFAHQHVPFERLVDALAPRRDPSRTPLVQVMMSLHDIPVERPRLGEALVTEYPPPNVSAQFDLALDFAERDGGLAFAVGYNTDLFDAATIERLAGHLTELLTEIASEPDRPVSVLMPTLTPALSAVAARATPTTRPRVAPAEYAAPRTEAEQALTAIWSEVLGVERIGVDDNFFDLGGDSIMILRVVARARAAGLSIATKDLLLRQTVAGLATAIDTSTDTSTDTAGATATTVAEPEPLDGEVPLTPVQRWFFETYRSEPDRFAMSVLLRLTDRVDPVALGAAVDALFAQHDALRMRFHRRAGGWHQEGGGIEYQPVFRVVDMSDVDSAGERAAIERAAAAARAGLNLTAGRLLRVFLLDFGARRSPLLFVTVHHLVIDGVSWRILLDDLQVAYEQAVAGQPISLGPRTTSWHGWARRLAAHTRSGGFTAELDHWRAAGDGAAGLPVDLSGVHTIDSTREVRCGLDVAETDGLLRRAPGVYRARINDLLVSALGVVLARWTGRDRIGFAMEGHGRADLFDDVDLTRTVGWFTSIHPVALTMPTGSDWPAVIQSVKRQLRAIPNQGIGYQALRYLDAPAARELAGQHTPQLIFNYLGQWEDSPPGTAGGGLIVGREDTIGVSGPDAPPAHPLTVTGGVERKRLRLVWRYSTAVHRADTVRRLAGELTTALRQIIPGEDR